MKSSTTSLITLAAAALLAAATFQEGRKEKQGEAKDATKKPPAAEMAPVKTGKEQEPLKAMAGTWDVVVKMAPMPGAPAGEEKGTETATLGCGGLWLTTDFKCQLMGSPFEGHSVCGWDADKKKYTSVWVDSMAVAMMHMEGTYDPATKTLTMSGVNTEPSGEKKEMRTTDQLKDAKTRIFTMYGKGPDGKDMAMMTITYTKKS